MPITRRAMLKVLAIGAAAAAVPGALWLRTHAAARRWLAESPVDRLAGSGTPDGFSGDNPDRSHQMLWDIAGYRQRRGLLSFDAVTPDEKVPLVIVGGGMSGLGTAWLTRELAPVILERADRFGGNARGESWEGVDYAIGAAYYLQAAPEEALYPLYQQWGLDGRVRIKTEEDPVLIDGTIYKDFWSGESAPDHRTQFEQLKAYFVSVLNETDGQVYPEMPTTDPAMLERLKALDARSFREHLEAVMKGPLHPHLVSVIDHYCWSSLGGTWEEVSAAAGLNFFAAEFGEVCVAPGGNAAVAERVLELLHEALPEANLRTGAIVFHVQVRADGVLVAYENADGEVRTVLARGVVLCCPKFVVKRILHEIEPARVEAIDTLRYRSYLLANVLLTEELSEEFYDLFLTNADPTRATDVVTATYARPGQGKTVLTLYRGLPYDGARPRILAADAHRAVMAEFERQIHGEILPQLKVSPSAVAGIRLTRWGHPLPLAAKGILTGDIPATLRAPFRERVFFVEQDNWALPAIETALGEALLQVAKIRQVVAAG